MKTYHLRPISDTRHADDKLCPDGGWKPLTVKQKARLSILARQAFEVQKVQGMAVKEWRHEIAIQVCGFRISEAANDHYSDLKSAFQDLAGNPEKAFKTQLRAVDNKRRVAMHKLLQACKSGGLHESYAASICHAQFKVPLTEASGKQLWCLFFTISKRGKKS